MSNDKRVSSHPSPVTRQTGLTGNWELGTGNLRKTLLWGVIAVAALFVADRFYIGPWVEEMKKVEQERQRVEQQLAAANAALAGRSAIAAEWKGLQERLTRERESDVLNEFHVGFSALCAEAGAQNISMETAPTQKVGERGEFVEHAVQVRFQAPWEAFVRLLWEMRREQEFLRIHRMTVTSKYERDNTMDVDLRVSTLELTPTRGGVKP